MGLVFAGDWLCTFGSVSGAARGGDSGGPVFGVTGHEQVIAKGVISGVAGSRLVWQDFGTAAIEWNILPVTG